MVNAVGPQAAGLPSHPIPFRVHYGDADGMVSGAIHTTAATIRPAMQVLKGDSTRVSSVFFMCLSDRVLVYGEI